MASLVISLICREELLAKILAIICSIVYHNCMWWAVIANIYDNDRIEKLESKIKELE